MRYRSPSFLCLIAASLLGGCAGGVRPAKTSLIGAESHATSDREERRPVESRLHVHGEIPTPAAPTYRIQIVLPPAAPTAGKEGGK